MTADRQRLGIIRIQGYRTPRTHLRDRRCLHEILRPTLPEIENLPERRPCGRHCVVGLELDRPIYQPARFLVLSPFQGGHQRNRDEQKPGCAITWPLSWTAVEEQSDRIHAAGEIGRAHV